MFNILFFTVIMVLGFSSNAFAHDCWLQPDTFSLGIEALIFARLFTGHSHKSQKELPFEKGVIPRLDIYSASGKIDLLPVSKEGNIPIVEYKPDFTGQGLIAMDKAFTNIELTKEQFTRYLGHEQQSEYLSMLEKDDPDKKQKERYARCMKALVLRGDDMDKKFYGQSTGQKLEIILLNNPFDCKKGDRLEAKVLFENSPHKNKVLTMYNLGNDGELLSYSEKTDENGIAGFNIEAPGIWLLRLVNIYPCPPGDDMDWESYWASYCFEIA